MIMLLALPVIAAVALAHRCLLLFAPSNIVIRRVRASRPSLNTAAVMFALAVSSIVMIKVLSEAVASGGPGWLNLIVLVLGWDVIKFGLVGANLVCRATAHAASRVHPARWGWKLRRWSRAAGRRTASNTCARGC